GTRSVVLNSKNHDAGDFSTLLDLTLSGNAGSIAVPPGAYGDFSASGNNAFVLGDANAIVPSVYNLQNLSLSGNATLQVVGPVILTLANGVTINNAVGSAAHPEWLTLRIANGGLSSGKKVINASVVAPNGAVILSGSATLRGTVISDSLTMTGNSL